jgi:hypothetical protein
MSPESESTYFCQIWTPPYSLIIRNPADNPTDIRHHRGPKEAPMKKTRPFIRFCNTVGSRRSGEARKKKEIEVDYAEVGMEYR